MWDYTGTRERKGEGGGWVKASYNKFTHGAQKESELQRKRII